MRKYRPPLTKYEEKKLKELSEKDFANWNETEVRESFIFPLLNLLGYKKDQDYDVTSEKNIKLNPLFQQIGSKSSKLDYICSVRKNKFWIIEAKSGYRKTKGTKSDIGEKDIRQAYFYSLLPEINCPYFIVTNGWYINFYKRDEIGENLEPILSIPHNSLPEGFLELDSYIGSTQILPHLKQTILNDIKNVLSAEVYLERLDEFVGKVKDSTNSIRPKVLENYRVNAESQEKRGKEDFIKFINQESLEMIPTTLFNNISTIGQMKMVSDIVLEKFDNSTPIQRKFFLHNAILEEPKPVTVDYYFNILIFLIKLYKSDPTCTDTFTGDTYEQILLNWIESLLFGFGKNPIIRYLWAFEGLVNRLTIRSLIISPETRKIVDSIVNTSIYTLPEEEIAWNGPNPASAVIRIIESRTLQMSGKIITLFYDNHKFKEAKCDQTYNEFKKMVEKTEKDTDNEYWKLKEELGDQWGTIRSYEFTNHYKDNLASATCHILKSEPDILKLLSPTSKDRIEIIANIRFDHEGFCENARIANFCENCCEILELDMNEVKISQELIERYFDPKEDPYNFKSLFITC